MMKEKLTPKDRKSIVARVKAGEKQVDVARDFGITQGYLSKIVKQSKINSTDIGSLAKPVDLSDKTADQLRNRYRQIHMDLLQYNGEIQQRLREADGLQQSIEAESAKPAHVRDEGWILAQKRRLTYCQDTTRIAYEMARLYQEVSAILIAFAKREIPVPYSVAITKGLTPGSQAK